MYSVLFCHCWQCVTVERNQNNMSELSDMFLRALLLQGGRTISNHLVVLCWSNTKRQSSSFHWMHFLCHDITVELLILALSDNLSLTRSIILHIASFESILQIMTIMWIIIPYIFVYYIKAIRQFRCFFGKFADEGDNPVNNPNILNVEGDNLKCVAKQNIQVLDILK